MYFHDRALIIKRYNLGEADKILVLLTAEQGKVAAVAKGIRRPQSRWGGQLDLLNLIRGRFFRGRAAGLLTLTEVVLEKDFAALKKNWEKIKAAYYFCELVDEFAPLGQKEKELFAWLEQFLQQLNESSSSALEELIKEGEIKLLQLNGFWSAQMFRGRRPQTLNEWRRFNRLFIERILGKKIKSWEL